MTFIRTFIASICLSLATAATSLAATVEDPIFYTDLDLGITHDLAGFDILGNATGPASLTFNYGVWNGPGSGNLWELTLTFNGVDLTPVTAITDGYFSGVGNAGNTATYDVSGLVTGGLNTLSAFATPITDTDGSYALGEISLDYTVGVTPPPPPPPSSVPLPASLPLLGLSLAGIGLFGRRRRKG